MLYVYTLLHVGGVYCFNLVRPSVCVGPPALICFLPNLNETKCKANGFKMPSFNVKVIAGGQVTCTEIVSVSFLMNPLSDSIFFHIHVETMCRAVQTPCSKVKVIARGKSYFVHYLCPLNISLTLDPNLKIFHTHVHLNETACKVKFHSR